MRWSWIDLNFPWLGAVASVVLLVLLFATSKLRGDLDQSRWKDCIWLSWLAVVIYIIHNVEEYGVDLLGQFHAFPDFMCSLLGLSPFPSCPIPTPFFLAVNLPLFWAGAPIAAIMSRRHPILGLSVYGVIFVNALTHLASFARAGYNPGVLTALILFLPVSVWVATACFGTDRLPYRGIVFIVADGVLLHAILMSSAILFVHHVIASSTLIAIQIFNALLFFLLAWLADQWRSGRFARSAVLR
jgi:hypothetical protein